MEQRPMPDNPKGVAGSAYDLGRAPGQKVAAIGGTRLQSVVMGGLGPVEGVVHDVELLEPAMREPGHVLVKQRRRAIPQNHSLFVPVGLSCDSKRRTIVWGLLVIAFKPTNLFWLLSFSCTERCSKCHHWHRPRLKSQVRTRDVVEFIHHLPALEEICLVGGEPLLHKEKVLKVIAAVQGRKIRTVINTNGCLLDAAFVDQIKDEDVHVVVSIDTTDREYWFFVRGRDSYDLVMTNLRNAAARLPGGALSVQSVLARETEAHLQGARDLCAELGLHHSIQDYMSEGFEGEWTALKPESRVVPDCNPCLAAGRNISILPDGDVYTCFQQPWMPGCEEPIGRLGQDTPEAMLGSAYTGQVLSRMTSCDLPCMVLRCNQE